MTGRHSRRLIDWATAFLQTWTSPKEIRGFTLMSYCTVSHHHDGCGCSRGTVRYFYTNHHKPSFSRSFDAIRDALGAVPHHRGGDIEVVR